MSEIYKIVGRNIKTGRQEKKRIYTCDYDFRRYAPDLVCRYKTYMNVEYYKKVDGKWELFLKVKCDKINNHE